jgi:hypothetical protein
MNKKGLKSACYFICGNRRSEGSALWTLAPKIRISQERKFLFSVLMLRPYILLTKQLGGTAYL